MDTTRSSRKRNHPPSSPSHPLYGRLTRSKSQIFLHRSRSGLLRSDTGRRKQPSADHPPSRVDTRHRLVESNDGGDYDDDMVLVEILRKKPKPSQEPSSIGDDDELSRVLTKDLRARRVYSPQSSAGACSSMVTNEFTKGNGVDSDFGHRRIADLGAESKPSVENSGCEKEGSKMDVGSNDFGKVFPSEGQNKDDVLRPRVQEKLFKAPGSFRFGRLFSFMKDIMGGDSGGPNLGHNQKDKDVNGQESQLPLSSPSQEAFRHELKSESHSTCDNPPRVSEGDAAVAPVNELSHGNGSKCTSSHYSLESPMLLHTKEVISDCLPVPSTNDKCLSESKADLIADFHCVQEVGNALLNDDLKHVLKQNSDPDYAKANHTGGALEQFGVVKECFLTTPPDADICDKSKVNKVDQLESNHPNLYNVKAMDMSSTQVIASEGFCLETDKSKDSTLKNKSVPRSNLHRKLFRNPGSVSYKRLLQFIMESTKDEYGHQSCHKKAEADIHAKRFQLPLPSQSQEASIDEHKIDSGPVHGTIESNALVDNILVDPTNELSHGNQAKLTSSEDLPELPEQLDEHIEKVGVGSTDECLSDKFDLCSLTVDFCSGDNVAQPLHCDGPQQAQNKISRQHNSKLPSKAQIELCINGSVSNLTPENCSSKDKGFYIDNGERKQFASPEKCESVSVYPPEGKSLNHLDTNMPDAEDSEKRSHEICRSDDAVVFNHVNVSNEEPTPSPEKIILAKSVKAGHGGHKARYVLMGKVYGPRLPSKRSNYKNANCVGEIRNSSEPKTSLVINRCSQKNLLKHAGSLNYKRMLPYVSNSMKDKFCAFSNDYCPEVQKCLDQTPVLPLSVSDLGVTTLSDSNGCVPKEQCGGNADTNQQTGLNFHDSNSDRASPISEVPESKLLHDSCQVIQLQHGLVQSNGRCKLASSPDPRISGHRIDLPVTPLGLIVDEAIAREDAASALPETSVHSEVKGNSSFLICSNGEKTPETHGCCQSLSPVTVLEKPRVSPIGFKKGILKRNPRGCRGLCTCLNCASFRLNAERAFEFSKNQFLDAEEVAQDLMKELSHLRNMLERSTESVNNLVFDGSQVKEACKKASFTEQLAKDRLSQMNDDLNIHCRISNMQRPRVRFADHVEEKIIRPDR